MQRTATCACGQASISVNSLPTMHGICHCTNCKRRTGSAFGVSAYFDRSSVIDKTGETSIYAFHHAPQKHDQQRHFCARCGTTLFWFVSSLPEKIGIAGGCFVDDGLPEPTYSVTHRKKEPWLHLPDSWDVWDE
jgi:hypothetical protein